MTKYILISFIKFITAMLCLLLLSKYIDKYGMLIYALSVLVFTSIISITYIKNYKLKKKMKLIQIKDDAPYYAIISGSFIYISIIIIICTAAAFIIPVRIYTFSTIEFLCLLVIFPVYILSKIVVNKIVYKIYKSDFAIDKEIYILFPLASVFLAVIYPVTVYLLKDINLGFSILDNNINSLAGSPVAYFIANILTSYDNIINTILSNQLITNTPKVIFFYILALLSGGTCFFYTVILFIEFFSLKAKDFKTVFTGKIVNTQNIDAASINKSNYFVSSFITVLLIFFIYPAVFVSIVHLSKKYEYIITQVNDTEQIVVEVINGITYKKGTVKEIQAAASKAYGITKDQLIENINTSFDNMQNNIDSYLDWYYSLSGEYSRILTMITGSLESYMQDTLTSKLAGDNNTIIDINVIKENNDSLQKEITNILNNNKISIDSSLYNIKESINIPDINSISETNSLINFQERLALSSTGALTTGTAAGIIASKVAAKTSFKTAVKAAAKSMAGKAAGAVVGTALGVAASIFTSPIGGIALGTATGVAIDKSLLSLEELINRDEYKKEISSIINDSKNDAISLVNKVFNSDNTQDNNTNTSINNIIQ